MENETEVVAQENDTEQTVNTEAETLDTATEVETLKKENATLKAQKEHWKKKAERPQESKPELPKEEVRGLSAKDFLALKDANISAEDFDEVQDFATYRKISIAEALANKTLKTILNERQEERRTAQATQTKGGARGSHQESIDDIISRAERGEIPTDDEGIAKLAQAHMARRKQKK